MKKVKKTEAEQQEFEASRARSIEDMERQQEQPETVQNLQGLIDKLQERVEVEDLRKGDHRLMAEREQSTISVREGGKWRPRTKDELIQALLWTVEREKELERDKRVEEHVKQLAEKGIEWVAADSYEQFEFCNLYSEVLKPGKMYVMSFSHHLEEEHVVHLAGPMTLVELMAATGAAYKAAVEEENPTGVITDWTEYIDDLHLNGWEVNHEAGTIEVSTDS